MKRTLGRTLAFMLAATALASSLGACASLPQRAWANGRAMGPDAGARIMYGNPQDMKALHQLYYSSTALPWSSMPKPFSPFSHF